MGGGAGGCGIGWIGHGHHAIGAGIAHHRATTKALENCEAMLRESGVEPPKRPNWFKRLWRSFFRREP